MSVKQKYEILNQPVLVRWMNLEPVIQSELSQKEKDKYRVLRHMYGIQKNGIDKPPCKEGMEMQTQRTDVDTVEEGESETNGEHSINIHT